jgi:hypothetical protein
MRRKKIIIIFYTKIMNTSGTAIDTTIVDNVPSNQKYFLFSYILPNEKQASVAFKFRGAYGDLDKCKDVASALDKEDGTSSIFAAKSGEWTLLKTDEEVESDIVEGKTEKIYENEVLNKIFKNFEEKQRKKQDLFEQRKRKMIEDGKDPDKFVAQTTLKTAKEEVNMLQNQLKFYTDFINNYKQS